METVATVAEQKLVAFIAAAAGRALPDSEEAKHHAFVSNGVEVVELWRDVFERWIRIARIEAVGIGPQHVVGTEAWEAFDQVGALEIISGSAHFLEAISETVYPHATERIVEEGGSVALDF